MESINNLNWADLIRDPDYFQSIADQQYQLHVTENENALDYSYVKNISIDVDYYLNLKITGEKKAVNHTVGQFGRVYTQEYVDAFPNEGTVLSVAEPDHSGAQVDELKKHLSLDMIYCLQQTQQPGKMHPLHTDLNRALTNIIADKNLSNKVKVKNIRKYIVYLEDWALGQVFMIGRHACTNWKKGDVISFPWFMPHSTANAGLVARPLIFISGVEF